MRPSQFLGLGVLLLVFGACGCTSNNKGKIEGTRWTSVQGVAKGLTIHEGAVFLDFRKDGKLLGHFGGQELTGRYELGMGATVTLHLDKALPNGKIHTEKVVIEGKTMTMPDPDGTKLTFPKW